MLERVTLRKVVAIVKLSVFFVWFWPLPLHASERKLLFMKLYQLLSIILTIGVIASMLYSLVTNLDDPNLVVKSALGLFPCSHVIWNVLCHLAIYQRLRYVIFEMEKFCTLIEPREEAIVQREYVDKCVPFYGFCVASFYTTLFALFVGPVVLDQPLPAQADFPFDASRQPLRAIAYIHQIIVGLLIAAHLSVNALMALLLWLVSARFRLLVEDMRTIANIYDFAKCIEKHQRLLEYAGEVALAVRLFALGTIIFSTISLIVFGLIVLTGTSLTMKVQFVFLAFSALSEVYMYAWPAEHLIHISSYIAHAAFEMDWCEESESFRKNLQMVVLRSQKPIIVALPCGLPSLSLRYYATFLSTIFSYFTTMRIMFEENADV